MRRPPYDCNLDERKLHVFLDGAKACLCCLRTDLTMQRCKHRPQAEVKVAQGNNEAGKTVK